jgi:hypothetical protein
MRGLACALLATMSLGCSTTVYRLDGEVKTKAGPARTPCEMNTWLVVAPTRYQEISEDGRRSRLRKDGLGLYRVGSEDPVSIPAAADDLGPSPLLAPHEAAVRDHDRDRVISTILGGAGIIALVAGAALFVTSFETTRSPSGEEEQRINTARGTWSGIIIAAGFGLGIGGLVLAPSQTDRTRADTARYVFHPPQESEGQVSELVARHNLRRREACARISGTPLPSERVQDEPPEDEDAEVEEQEPSDDTAGDADSDEGEGGDAEDEF